MRFLHIVSSLNFGGVERLVTELALEQQRHGLPTAIYCYNHKTGGLLQPLADAGIPVFGPEQPALGRQRQMGLAQCARAWQPDVVHSHLNFSLLAQVLACARLNGPRSRFAVTQHSTIEGQLAVLRRAVLNYRLARPFIQLFTAVSAFAARRAGQSYGLNANKFIIIYNGVRPEQYQFEPLARERLRQTLQLPPAAIVWGTAGRLAPLKGHDILLRAFSAARQADPRLYLLLLGAGPELSRLQALARALGCEQYVIWPGEQSDVRGWLSICDHYVHASHSETLSLAILEALANGLPVLATQVGGVEEIAALSRDVVLVPDGQPEAMAQAMLRPSGVAPLARPVSKLPDPFLFETMYQTYAAHYQRLAR